MPNLHQWVAVAAAKQPAPPTDSAAPSGLNPLFLIAAMVLCFWLIVMRPQRKERQERKRLLDTLKKGDRVVTVGGIHGRVADVDTTHGIVTVEVAPKVALKVNRTAISTVDAKDSGKTPSQEESENKQA